MIRKEREITDKAKIKDIIKNCQVLNLALNDENYPYVIPMNFGFRETDDKYVLYFHCGRRGKKLELLERNNKVAFSMFTNTILEINEMACKSTMKFESICGNGIVKFVDDIDEKLSALSYIMQQYTTLNYEWEPKYANAVRIFKLEINELYAKSNIK